MLLDALDFDLLELPAGWQGMRPYRAALKPHPVRPLCAVRVARTDARGGGVGVWNVETGRLELKASRRNRWCWRAARGAATSKKSVLRLGPPRRAAGIDSKFGYMLDLPVFSSDEARGGYGEHWLGGWWAHPDDDIAVPARGGRVTFGWIFDHRLPSHAVRWHELVMEIPKGFLLPDPESAEWQGPGHIAPLGEGFSMTLPGGRRFEIDSSPPDVIELPTPAVERPTR